MNNIVYFDVCAIIITLVFYLSAICNKHLRGRTNKIFFLMLSAMLFSAIADFATGVLENYAPHTQKYLVMTYVANYVYFVCHNFIMPIYVLYIYSSVDIWHIYRKKKTLNICWQALVSITVIVIALNGFLTNVFSVSDDLVYSRGPWIMLLYVIAAFFGIWGALILIYYRKHINKDKRVVLLFLYIIVLAGIAVQFFIPEMLTEAFGISVALLFYMTVVQRTEALVDPVTGATKYNAAIERVTKNFVTHKPVVVTLIKIVNYHNIRLYLGQERYAKYLRMQTQKLNAVAAKCSYSAEVFYLESGLFAYLAEDTDFDKAMRIGDELKNVYAESENVEEFNVMSDARICLIRCPEDIAEFQTLYTLGTTFHKTMPATKDVLIFANYKNDLEYIIRNEMEDIINRALEQNRFELYYQPIYSTRENRFVSAEALIRLNDEDYGFIPPSYFLPIAEMNGAIHEIGDYVIETVVRFISTNDMDAMGLKYIEINLSAAQCIEVDLVEKVMVLLEDYGVDPGRISLELTESSADINPAIVDQNVMKLHKAGVRFALDDYGTGYSNIKRVTSLPIDQVKMDKSFVDMIDDPQMWIVIKDTVTMLKEMGKEVLIEGVEEENVAKRFTELDADLIQGCELIQGFYFCEPLAENEFIEFMEKHAKKSI